MNESTPNATLSVLADAKHGWEEGWPFDFYETSALVACCMVGLLVLAVLVEWGLLIAAAVREQPRYAQTGKAYQQQGSTPRLRSAATTPSYGQSSAVVSPYGQSLAVVPPYSQLSHAQAQHSATSYMQPQRSVLYTHAQDQHPMVFTHTPQGKRFPIPVYPCARAVTLPLWG